MCKAEVAYSLWLPSTLLLAEHQARLTDALFAASRHAHVDLHFQKGLAGGSEQAIAATSEAAMNPKVLDAFALVIVGAEAPPTYPGLPGHEPDVGAARLTALATSSAA
jgi:hypothetical protein